MAGRSWLEIEVLIQKRLAFSPRLFYMTVEMISVVFKCVSLVNGVENPVTLPLDP